MSKMVVIVLGLVLIIGGIWYVSRDTQEQVVVPNESAVNEDMEGDVKEFEVRGSNFAFSPSEMKVNVGDRVRVTFINDGGTHDWKLDEFSASTQIIQTGEQETIEFTADTAGTFEYYCSVGSHREMGMIGSFIVEE